MKVEIEKVTLISGAYWVTTDNEIENAVFARSLSEAMQIAGDILAEENENG